MMLRVGSEYLDFNAPITQERKVKLFEEIDSTQGDVSFEFEIYLSSRNANILGFPFPDNARKRTYQRINATLLNDEGQSIAPGFIKIERKIGNTLYCSFFGGNSDWFAALTGNLRDLTGGQVEINEANIQASWDNTSGVIFPLVDSGILNERGHAHLLIDDFHPFVYLHTLVKAVFQKYSIKLTGELFTDWLYRNAIVSSGWAQDVESHRVSAKKTASTAVDNTANPIPFEDVSAPFFSPDYYNPVTGAFTAPYRMIVKVKATVIFSDESDLYQISPARNSMPIPGKLFYSAVGEDRATMDVNVFLEAGNTLTVYAEVRNTGGTANAIGGTLDITPLFVYNLASYGEILPDWTEAEFISNVFRIFNALPSYDIITKTLTVNLFDKLNSKDPVDISRHIKSQETDYVEFVSEYAKRNKLIYDSDDNYGSGVIETNNEFLEEETEALESDFFTRPAYKSKAFKTNVEKLEFMESFEYVKTEINSITDSSDIARFNVTSTSLMSVGQLVRIETENGLYDGDYVIGTVGVGFFEIDDLSYLADDTGTALRILQIPEPNDEFHILVSVPDILISSFSDAESYLFEGSEVTRMAYAYFNLWDEGRVINTMYRQSLFFGSDGTENFYQRTVIDTYWSQFRRVLNDPVKERIIAQLPWVVHHKIDFLRPIQIKTLETTNLYYCNLERGYQNSYTDCELELIKLP